MEPFTILYDFLYGAGDPVPPMYPQTLLEGPDGNIYGTTSTGGPLPTEGFSFTYGVLYRYDGPQTIAVLTSFDAASEQGISAGGHLRWLLCGTYTHLVHIDLDGTQTLAWDATNGNTLPGDPVIREPAAPAGWDLWDCCGGGANQSGFVFHYVPGEGTTDLYDFTQDYYSLDRLLIVGNDGLIYGLAAIPEDYASHSTSFAAARRFAVTAAKKSPPPKAHTFRFRAKAEQSANFVPVAKPDSAWLPANASFNKQRAVTVDVLANDKDPDKNPLTLTGVVPPDSGYAELVSTAGKLHVRYVTTDPDPASEWLHYHIADGKGGTATGDLIIHSLATGKYTGTATDTAIPPTAPATVSVAIGEKNAITATFIQGKVRYTGKSVLGIDETASFPLAAGKNTPLNMHLSLKRGATRQMTVTVQGGGSAYSAVFTQTGK